MTDPILGISRISPKHQVTIPKDVMEAFKLKPGDRIIFREDNGMLILTKS